MKPPLQPPYLTIERALSIYKHSFKKNPTFGMDVYKEDFMAQDVATLQKDGSLQKSATPIKFDFFSLSLCLKGCAVHIVNQHEFQVEEYSFQLVPAGSMFSQDIMREQTEIYIILFTEAFIKFGNDKHGSENIERLFEYHNENMDNIILASNMFTRVKTIFEDIDAELHDKRDDYLLIIKLLILKLLFILKREKRAKHLAFPKYKTRAEQIAHRYMYLIEKHFLRFKKVSDYAPLLDITPKHLTETVGKTLGKSALWCIHSRILQEALYLLEHTPLSINQIATYLGFNTPSDFSRFFTHYYHISPKTYRLHIKA